MVPAAGRTACIAIPCANGDGGGVTVALLAIQADAPPGMVAGALAALADRDVEVHQATGMVAAGLRVTTAEAPVRLRAAAYTDDDRWQTWPTTSSLAPCTCTEPGRGPAMHTAPSDETAFKDTMAGTAW